MFPPKFVEHTDKMGPLSPLNSRAQTAPASPATPNLARDLIDHDNLVSPETDVIVLSRKRIVHNPSDDEERIDGN